jgi:hypothetical protein
MIDNIKSKVSNPEQWEIYKNKAKESVIFSQMSYLNIEKHEDEIKSLAELMPKDFELICSTDTMDEDIRKNEFRSMFFINRKTKEIVVACSGTRFGFDNEGRGDLIADAALAMQIVPDKLESGRQLNKFILDSLGKKASKYKFHYTGHSLGAALSDMLANDMNINLIEKGIKPESISSLTFENAGCKKIVEEMYDKKGIDRERMDNIDHTILNSRENVINTCAEHIGKIYKLTPDSMQDLSSIQLFFIWLFNKINELVPAIAGAFRYFDNEEIAKKTEDYVPVVTRGLEILTYGSHTTQLDAHKLSYFKDILVEGKAGTAKDQTTTNRDVFYASEVVTNTKAMLYDKAITLGLMNGKEEKGDVGEQKYHTVSPEGKITTASKTEIESVLSSLKSKMSYTEIVKRERSDEKLDVATYPTKLDPYILATPSAARGI